MYHWLDQYGFAGVEEWEKPSLSLTDVFSSTGFKIGLFMGPLVLVFLSGRDAA